MELRQTGNQHTILEAAGGIGLFVDTKDAWAKRFFEGFGFVPLPSNPLQLFRPVKTIQAVVNTSATAE